MSELKVYRDPKQGPCWREFYEKSEVDDVIAEKDEKIDELQKVTDFAWSKVNTMYDELRHNKYKRCLAMAAMCVKEVESLECLVYGVEGAFEKHTLYKKWRQRWLELAKKFELGN